MQAQGLASVESSYRAYGQGTLTEIHNQRLSDLMFMYSGMFFIAPNILRVFLFGLYAGRRGIFHNLPEHLPLFRKALWWGLGLGVVGNAVYTAAAEFINPAVPSPLGFILMIFYTFGVPAMTTFYISSIVLLVHNEALRARLGPLGSVGRMALTNYLLQSVVCTLIFYNIGLGRFGTFSVTRGLLLTFAIYGLQLPLSVWWLNRFQMGPLEWLWRSLTYGRLQPMRIGP
jgi:uncharacterized protein